jgi:phosphoribosyl-AMP cyclohydrolase
MTSKSTTNTASADQTIETTRAFQPEFGPDGLIPAIVTDRTSGDVLMFAYMNEEALKQTIASGFAHFWSRSRAKIWKKGDESGNLLKVIELRTDCDQDVIWIAADVEGDGVACHTGARSCFYRRVVQSSDLGGAVLEFAALPEPKKGE